MKRRILSMLCVLAMLMGMITVPAFAADTTTETSSNYALFEDAENLTVETDTYIDLNGYSISGVTVKEGVTLFVRDTKTDDYDVADGLYGAVTDITGAVKAADGYVAVTREGAVSFHKADLSIKSMSLRPGNAGVYYTSNFAADQIVAEAVESYGVALSVAAEPDAENLETLCGYSVLYDFGAGAASGTLLTGIMDEANTAQENAANAATTVYGRAYIKTADGYSFGATVSRNLQEQVEAIDAMLPSLTETQKSGFLAMYHTYEAAMADWNIPNLRGTQLGDNAITVPVKTENGVVTETVTVEKDGMSVTIPFGTLVDAAQLTLTVTKKAQSDSGIEAAEGQTLMPFDVHVEGVSPENTVPLTVALGKVMPENLNLGNYSIYHVEAAGTNEMTLVANEDAFTAHNQFKYTLDGELTLHMATFSEVPVVYDNTAKWEGGVDHSWYTETVKENSEATEFEIRNADQLWSLSQIVGGMASGIDQDSFSGKTIKLLADIDLYDGEADNDPDKIFYPIGYWNNEGTYERLPVEERVTAVSSGFYTFEGTFDGNGNTISNLYQNTWEMKGDHNWYDPIKEQYFRDGMGLFGKVYGGTVKNLTVRNFKSDGEITTTGVIAAYADFGATFENIAISDCNPRVYNIGNGGIVGCAGWYAKDDNSQKPITFKNITVDQTNKISALWGTYDASCGGILGQYYSNSGQTGSPKNGQIHFINCHVAAIMDVNNDVCANYQYYWYRYSGMLMGTVRANKTEGGYTVADTSDIVAENCTYTYGSWNEYWYCELVKNSSASYTHDYQFGRLTNIDNLSEIKSGETWLKEGNFALVSDDRKSVECYHIFKNSEGNLYRHFHDVADESNPEIYESFDLNGDGELNDLKEDRQRYYLPFGQVLNGLGYGVKPTYELDGFTLVKDGSVISGPKFQVKDGANLTYEPGQTIKLSDIVELAKNVNISKVSQSSLYAAVSPVDENGNVSATYSRDVENWLNNTITFSKDSAGAAKLVITDYFYCEPTVITLNEYVPSVDKFVATDLTEVNAGEAVKLGSLFTALDNVTIDSENVVVSVIGGTYTFNKNADWTKSTICFTEATSYTVEITDNNLCNLTKIDITANPVEKFTANTVAAQNAYTQITLGNLFGTKNGATIGNVTAIVTDPNGAVVTLTGTEEDWTTKTIDLVKDGEWKVTIMDDDAYCSTTTATFVVNKADKFTKKFDKDFLYRVGNKDNVGLGYVFDEIETPVKLSAVNVTIDNVAGDAAGTFTSNATWTSGTIKFTGTGVVKVTISADGAESKTLNLEVVDAKNIASAVGATGENVVLLKDVNASTYVNYNTATVYGNGFTYSLNGAPTAYNSKQGHGIIITKNATLDNLVIVGDVYDSYGAYSNQDYYNAAVDVAEYTVIRNCYISGCAAPIMARNSVTIIDSTLYGGTVANLLIKAGTATLENVTTANYDDGRKLAGMGIVFHTDAGDTAKLVLKGTLRQYNFISEAKTPSDTYAKMLYSAMFGSDCSKYHFGTSPNRYVNTGIISMSGSVDISRVDDQAATGYSKTDVTVNGENGFVYTQLNTSGSVNNNYNNNTDIHYAKIQGPVVPDSDFDYTTKNYVEKVDGKNDYCYAEGGIVHISMDDGDTFNWDTSILTAIKAGQTLGYTVSMDGVDYTGKSIAFSAEGKYDVVYTYTDPYNYKLDAQGNVITYSVPYTETIHISVSVIKATTKHAEFTFGSGQAVEQITVNNATYLSATNKTANGTSWGCMTVGTSKIYYPIVEADIVQTKASSIFNTNAEVRAYFYVFDGTITITDYENGGTGNPVTYSESTTAMPSNLTVVKGNFGAVSKNTTWYSSYNDSSLSLTGAENVFKYAGSNAVSSTPTTNGSKLCYASDSGLSTKNRSEYFTLAQYSYTDNAGMTYYYYIGYHMQDSKNVAPDYSSGSGSGTCIAEGSLITMANGSKRAVEDLRKGDLVMAFDHVTGEVVSREVNIVGKTYADVFYRNVFVFDDGTELNAINEHGIYDMDLRQYVNIGHDNYQEYLGHRFVSIDSQGNIGMKHLVDVITTCESGYKYDIVTNEALTYVVEDTLSVTHEIVMIINSFAFGDDLCYDAEAMQADIEEYGLYTYDDFAEYCEQSVFEKYNMAMMKVGVGKGLYTKEHLIHLLVDIALNDDVQIVD